MANQSTSIPVLSLTFRATGSVAANRAIGFAGAQVSVAGAKVKGVSPRSVAVGEYSDVDVLGTTIIETGGAFGIGASLIADAQGRAVAASGALGVAAGEMPVTSGVANGAAALTGADLPEYVFADALEASSGAGQFVEVLLRR